tara:strand:- start:82735 stop:82872 length:138 start_codon:yes stop_codon:yes gene_type:complete
MHSFEKNMVVMLLHQFVPFYHIAASLELITNIENTLFSFGVPHIN